MGCVHLSTICNKNDFTARQLLGGKTEFSFTGAFLEFVPFVSIQEEINLLISAEKIHLNL